MRSILILFLTGLLINFSQTICISHELQNVFSHIYTSGMWLDEGSESYSGLGSKISATEVIRNELPKLIKKFNISTLLDIPCGDFNWMKITNLGATEYIGADIVESVVYKNNELYKNNQRSFLQLDITCDKLPKVDLILCRDCLAHLSLKHVVEALKNCKNSGSTYLLVTHFAGGKNNHDILDGEWQPLNLLRTPFNFPNPIMLINEASPAGPDKKDRKYLILWKLDQLDVDAIVL